MKITPFTQTEILDSKAWKSKNGATVYPNPNELFNPIINFERENLPQEYQIEGTHVLENVNEDESINRSFGRINFFKEYEIDEELKYRIGIIFSFEKSKPIVKIYSGVHVTACTNMCIFSADQIIKIDISNNMFSYAEVMKEQFLKIEDNVEKTRKIILELKKIHFTEKQCDLFNGYLLRMMNLNPANVVKQNPIINAIKLQSDKNNKYFSGDGLTAWLYYNSMTEYLNEKIHILDIPEKAFEIYNLLKPLLQQGTKTQVYLDPAQMTIEEIIENDLEQGLIIPATLEQVQTEVKVETKTPFKKPIKKTKVKAKK